MKLLLVGGVFDREGGRPSGYFGKLSAAIVGAIPVTDAYHEVGYRVVNGGSYVDLVGLLGEEATHIIWFADVPNDHEKVLSRVLEGNVGAVLVQSKSNIGKRYDRDQLQDRMVASGAEMLVEFDRGDVILGRVLSISGRDGDWTCDVDELGRHIAGEFARIDDLIFPLDRAKRVDVPTRGHVGAFGVERKMHIHEGVDLYGDAGQWVYAMEDGVVVGVHQFTGVGVGSPWWKDTWCVLVEGASGVINYGEVKAFVEVGEHIHQGKVIGELATVLAVDKGRPMTMLHIERYVAGTTRHIDSWDLGMARPKGLLDPTMLLLGNVK